MNKFYEISLSCALGVRTVQSFEYKILSVKFISCVKLHKKRSFPLRISLVNVTKPAVSCEFRLIY